MSRQKQDRQEHDCNKQGESQPRSDSSQRSDSNQRSDSKATNDVTEPSNEVGFDEPGVAAMQIAELALQEVAEQEETVAGDATLPAVSELSEAQALAMSPGFQALINAVLPLVGAQPSRPGEFPGVFKVEPGEEEDEALVYLDVPASPYRRGQRGDMARVLALSVKMTHDYRKLGEQYYCIDCESPTEETRH